MRSCVPRITLCHKAFIHSRLQLSADSRSSAAAEEQKSIQATATSCFYITPLSCFRTHAPAEFGNRVVARSEQQQASVRYGYRGHFKKLTTELYDLLSGIWVPNSGIHLFPTYVRRSTWPGFSFNDLQSVLFKVVRIPQMRMHMTGAGNVNGFTRALAKYHSAQTTGMELHCNGDHMSAA